MSGTRMVAWSMIAAAASSVVCANPQAATTVVTAEAPAVGDESDQAGRSRPVRRKHAGGPPDRSPLAYGRDFVRVTAEGTLSVRYRAWDDFWGANLASYLGDARQAAAARDAPPKRVRFAGVRLKNVEITCPNHPGGDGKPMRGTFTISAEQERLMQEEARKVQEFFFAASDGKLIVDFIFPVVDGLKVESPHKAVFSIWPRGLQDQLLPALREYEHANVAMWVFVCSRPLTLNPPAPGKGIGPGPFGICYPAWPLYGGYCMTTSTSAAGLWVHEFNHRYLDGLKNHEGIQLTKVHGLGLLGYAPGRNLDESYFNAYRHLIRPAIYDRFSIGPPHRTPLEPFAGKAYTWSEVQDDCWVKLPELRSAELARLTGITSIEIDTRYGGGTRLFRVAPADRRQVSSRYVEPPRPPIESAARAQDGGPSGSVAAGLDNYLQTSRESCAVLKTDTGQWLFVSVNMADLYADMLKISGRGDEPLEVYGYVNEGVLPLLVFKAPADMELPSCEEGYFRHVP